MKSKPQLLGEFRVVELKTLSPNTWNPNTFTDALYDSLLFGLRDEELGGEGEGWVASQALLVWGSDETGAKKSIIIDGEHRWRAALEVGHTEGPAVFLEGISEHAAKALTIKLDQKRGTFDVDRLESLVESLNLEGDYALSLGIGTFAKVEADVELEEEDTPITYTLFNEEAEELRELLAQVAKKLEVDSLSYAALNAYRQVLL